MQELMRGVFVLGLPVAALTFVVVWWGMQRGMFDGLEENGKLEKRIEALGKQRKQARKNKETVKKGDFLHEKWMKFGGGFYGMVAMYTLIRLELADVAVFLASLSDLILNLDFSVIVRLIVESVMDFVAAITWPVYWLQNSGSSRLWLWLFVAYGGYWSGLKVSERYLTGSDGDASTTDTDEDEVN